MSRTTAFPWNGLPPSPRASNAVNFAEGRKAVELIAALYHSEQADGVTVRLPLLRVTSLSTDAKQQK